jgi:hypothetical protein
VGAALLLELHFGQFFIVVGSVVFADFCDFQVITPYKSMDPPNPYANDYGNGIPCTAGMDVEGDNDASFRTPSKRSISLDNSTASNRTATTVGSSEDESSQEFPPLPAHAIESGSKTGSRNNLIGATRDIRILRGDVRRKLSDHELEEVIDSLIAKLAVYPDAPKTPEELCFVKKIDDSSIDEEKTNSTIYRQGNSFYKRVAVSKKERDELVKKYFNSKQHKKQDPPAMNEDAASPSLPTAHNMMGGAPTPEMSAQMNFHGASGPASHFCLCTFTGGKRERLVEYCERHGIGNVHDNSATHNMDVLLRCAEAAGNDMTDEEMVRYFFDFITFFWLKYFDQPSMDIDDDDDDDGNNDDEDYDYNDNEDDFFNDEDDMYDEFTFSEDEFDPDSKRGSGNVGGKSLMKSVFQTMNRMSLKDTVDTMQSPPSLETPCSMPLIDSSISSASLHQKHANAMVTCSISPTVEDRDLFINMGANMPRDPPGEKFFEESIISIAYNRFGSHSEEHEEETSIASEDFPDLTPSSEPINVQQPPSDVLTVPIAQGWRNSKFDPATISQTLVDNHGPIDDSI